VKKSLLLFGLSSVILCTVGATGQDIAATEKPLHQKHAKLIAISGKLSDDGKTLASDATHRTWVIANKDALRGYEGRQLSVRGKVGPEANRLEVISVKAQAAYTANWGDSAFRR